MKTLDATNGSGWCKFRIFATESYIWINRDSVDYIGQLQDSLNTALGFETHWVVLMLKSGGQEKLAMKDPEPIRQWMLTGVMPKEADTCPQVSIEESRWIRGV